MDSKKLEELVLACKKGSRKARASLYKTYAPMLLGICLRYSKNREEAEDILHEAFIKIYTKIDQSGRGSFEAWMKAIVRNESLYYLRKQASEFKNHNRYEKDTEGDTDEDEDINAEGISANVILSMIQALPQGYRLVFNLYVFEEKSHKEISNLLDISESTSKTQLLRGKKQLQKHINEYRNQMSKPNK